MIAAPTIRPFTLYRIICTANNKAFVSGSNQSRWHQNEPWRNLQWYDRGTWGRTSGAFFKSRDTITRHLLNLCHDWETVIKAWVAPNGETHRWRSQQRVTAKPILLRLEVLRVEETVVNDFGVTEHKAADFIGALAAASAA